MIYNVNLLVWPHGLVPWSSWCCSRKNNGASERIRNDHLASEEATRSPNQSPQRSSIGAVALLSHFQVRDGLVPAEPLAPTRSAPRPRPGGCGFASPSPSIKLIVALPRRPFTAPLPPSRRARRASPGQHGGPTGLVCEPDDVPSRGTRGLVPGSPEASSRQSSFDHGGDYKTSLCSPPRRCFAVRWAGTALLVSWVAWT